eukprot:scaffold103520_cov63-Phaeocystis_antarctica.AAC.5
MPALSGPDCVIAQLGSKVPPSSQRSSSNISIFVCESPTNSMSVRGRLQRSKQRAKGPCRATCSGGSGKPSGWVCRMYRGCSHPGQLWHHFPDE